MRHLCFSHDLALVYQNFGVGDARISYSCPLRQPSRDHRLINRPGLACDIPPVEAL